jgi:hypothetical protein
MRQVQVRQFLPIAANVPIGASIAAGLLIYIV